MPNTVITSEYCLNIPDAEIYYCNEFLSVTENQQLLSELHEQIRWTTGAIKLFGKTLTMPRLLAWYADSGIQYTYSGQTAEHNDWITPVLSIKHQAEQALAPIDNTVFNGALLNYYRDGQDSMGWHSDNEPELGADPSIASISLGASRRFQLQHRHNKTLSNITLTLEPGSLLLMRGKTQHYWRHQLPKTKKPVGPRINITFRRILE